MANSRPLLRRDATLVSPPFSSAAELWFCRFPRGQLPRKLRHFNSRQPRLKSFVPALEPRAIDGLLQRIARQHAKYDRQPAVHLCQLQPSRRLRTNVIVMCRLAPQHAANRNQRIVPPASRQLLRRQRQFERTRNPDHIHVFARSSASTAAASSRSVIKLLNRLTTIPNRNPEAFSSPSIRSTWSLFAIRDLNHARRDFNTPARLFSFTSFTSSTSFTSRENPLSFSPKTPSCPPAYLPSRTKVRTSSPPETIPLPAAFRFPARSLPSRTSPPPAHWR